MRALLTFGTRPEAIKMAPLVVECKRRPESIEMIVCVTGQHREMLTQVTDYFGIQPDVDLDLMTQGQTLAEFLARALTGLDDVLQRHRPDCVVAQGDTTTVMAASLAAFYRRVDFVHVEAGLRTGNIFSPWPEEMNRRIASLATTLHCAPTPRAAANLLNEGVAAGQIHVTGNTVIDALLATVERERGNAAHWQKAFPMLGERRMMLITGHRRESFGEGIERICQAIGVLAARYPETVMVYSVHRNPEVWRPVHARLAGYPNVLLCPPASYPAFVWLLDRSTLILTDSGGVQEEAPSLGKLVMVMRDATERPEAVESGYAVMVGTSVERIVDAVARVLAEPPIGREKSNPYGDGHAAERIADLMTAEIAPLIHPR
jgi:UDP-N-acetylglucosamine 2-epimerase (non-hydrolysing)